MSAVTPSSSRPSSEAAGQDPTERLGGAFKQAMVAFRRLRGRETHRSSNLSYAQYGLLFGLAGGKALSARELAETAALSAATVTQMLESLECHGLVERVRSDRDKRVVLTRLTDRGQAVVEERKARNEPRWREAMSGFSPRELKAAAAVLERIAVYFDELE